jgi:excisionase family DNA binding protein
MDGMESRDLVDVAEASRLTGLAKATLYKLAHEGGVRSFKVLNRALRFDRRDLLALVQENDPVGVRRNE